MIIKQLTHFLISSRDGKQFYILLVENTRSAREVRRQVYKRHRIRHRTPAFSEERALELANEMEQEIEDSDEEVQP